MKNKLSLVLVIIGILVILAVLGFSFSCRQDDTPTDPDNVPAWIIELMKRIPSVEKDVAFIDAKWFEVNPDYSKIIDFQYIFNSIHGLSTTINFDQFKYFGWILGEPGAYIFVASLDLSKYVDDLKENGWTYSEYMGYAILSAEDNYRLFIDKNYLIVGGIDVYGIIKTKAGEQTSLYDDVQAQGVISRLSDNWLFTAFDRYSDTIVTGFSMAIVYTGEFRETVVATSDNNEEVKLYMENVVQDYQNDTQYHWENIEMSQDEDYWEISAVRTINK